jgi:hypothetical protein
MNANQPKQKKCASEDCGTKKKENLINLSDNNYCVYNGSACVFPKINIIIESLKKTQQEIQCSNEENLHRSAIYLPFVFFMKTGVVHQKCLAMLINENF